MRFLEKSKEYYLEKETKEERKRYYLERLSGGRWCARASQSEVDLSVNGGGDVYSKKVVMGFEQDRRVKALDMEPSLMQSLLHLTN